MNRPVFLPFLALAGLILLVGLACGTVTTPTPQSPVQGQPTNPPPIKVLPTESPQTQPTSESPAYFTEDFTATTLPDWSWFLMSGDEENFSLISGDDILKFDLEGKNVWLYLLYDPYTYTDIRLEARAENRGKNNNNVSFICRYSDEGWYEFNIANNGLYWILAYIEADQDYHTIYNGGSNAIKTGKDVNDYAASCIGNTLTLWINGTQVRTVDDNTYKLREGQIGIGVSSFDVWPIIVEWDYITASQP